MRILGVLAIAFPAALLAGSSGAWATTIDYTGAGAADYDDVSQSYGDSAEVDFTYRTLNGGNNWGQGATQTADHAEYWNDQNYSSDNAIFANANGNKLEVNMQAGPGLAFQNAIFDLGSYPNATRTIAVKVFDAGWNLLLDDAALVVDGSPAGALVSLSGLNTTALHFQMGDDWDTGVRSITFTTAAVSAVPIPGALLLFGTALAGLAGAARRKTGA